MNGSRSEHELFVERKRTELTMRDTACKAICKIKYGLRQPGAQEDGRPVIPEDWEKLYKPMLGSYIKFLLSRPDQFRVVEGSGPGFYTIEDVTLNKTAVAPVKGKDKGKGKGKRAQEVPTYDKGKSHCKGKNKGKREQGGPTYDPSTPCGYFMAGFCRHGDRCAKQHSVPYALAIRHEWLHPGDSAARQLLQSAAEQVLGSAWLDSSRLFPRVFSQRLEAAKPKFTSCRHVPCDLSDLGFSWDAGGGEQCRARPQPDTLQPPPTQRLRYLLVLDLEGKDEITEFPVLAIDAVLKCELGRFQHYVQPVHLFDGCALTESSPAIPFTQLLTIFDGWLRSTLGRSLHDIGQRKTDTAFVTCGDWDCKHVHTQCGISRIPVPAAFSQWVNIKRLYSDTYGGDFRGMKSMLSRLCLLDSKGDPKFGFHHLGMHDVENIGRCLMHLLEHNVEVAINGWKK
mmetsp:Transcript_75853/g.209365  ORF Transcript_75853/g.209365 Transcript_75853/m.209365 type:complete len:454 (-) Transcript_75853:116-1477(-)